MAGMSGSIAERLTVVTARARSLPVLMCSIDVGMASKKTSYPLAPQGRICATGVLTIPHSLRCTTYCSNVAGKWL